MLIALDGRRRWTYNFGYDAATDAPEAYTVERCRRIVLDAIGDESADVRVRDVRASHKKFEDADLIGFRNRFGLPLSDAEATSLAFCKPADDSPEIVYLKARQAALGGSLPRRETACDPVAVPELAPYARFAVDAEGKAMSTTMAFVRMLGSLLRDPALGPRIVPIVADEARTFGMANLFKQVGIYSSVGQRYVPEDIDSILSYREATDGQILEEGISEAGAIASWTAAATSYSVHGVAMLPFYIYHSMFGFQRVGDQIWAAADQRPRGFLIGATSGRTTLGGEGLQHQDGTSHLIAATMPEHPSVVWRKRHFPKVAPRYRVTSILSVLELVAQGLGVGILPLFLAEGRRDLVRLTEPLADGETELWLLTHPESRHLRRVGAVYTHLAQTLSLP